MFNLLLAKRLPTINQTSNQAEKDFRWMIDDAKLEFQIPGNGNETGSLQNAAAMPTFQMFPDLVFQSSNWADVGRPKPRLNEQRSKQFFGRGVGLEAH